MNSVVSYTSVIAFDVPGSTLIAMDSRLSVEENGKFDVIDDDYDKSIQLCPGVILGSCGEKRFVEIFNNQLNVVDFDGLDFKGIAERAARFLNFGLESLGIVPKDTALTYLMAARRGDISAIYKIALDRGQFFATRVEEKFAVIGSGSMGMLEYWYRNPGRRYPNHCNFIIEEIQNMNWSLAMETAECQVKNAIINATLADKKTGGLIRIYTIPALDRVRLNVWNKKDDRSYHHESLTLL